MTNKTPTPARNLSIWLLPGPNTPEYQGLGDIINFLAQKHGNAPFPPHVTLSMLPFDFPLEVVRNVVDEMKEGWFLKRIEFETIFTTTVGIAVHGRRGNQTTRGVVREPKRPPADLLGSPGHDQGRIPKKKKSFIKRIVEHVTPTRAPPPPSLPTPAHDGEASQPVGDQQSTGNDGRDNGDSATSTAILQQRFHDRLQEEVQKRRLAGSIAPETLDVRNIVPWFPHLSLAYTEKGQEEGIREIAEKGWYTKIPQGNPDDPIGIELAGFNNYRIGAIYFAYCGGLKPEKWTIFERIEDGTVQGLAQAEGAVKGQI